MLAISGIKVTIAAKAYPVGERESAESRGQGATVVEFNEVLLDDEVVELEDVAEAAAGDAAIDGAAGVGLGVEILGDAVDFGVEGTGDAEEGVAVGFDVQPAGVLVT